MENDNFTWIPFYRELAQKLLPYKENRTELVRIVNELYRKTEIKQPQMEYQNGPLTDIDPFSFYAIFNRNYSNENRRLFLQAIREIFSLTSEIPDNFFIPTVNAMNSWFYPLLNLRKEEDIPNLWQLFECAYYFNSDSTETAKLELIQAFDKATQLRYIGVRKMTIGLSWINPYAFLSLDPNTTDFITKNYSLPGPETKLLLSANKRITGASYLDLAQFIKETCLEDKISPYKSFPELSLAAYPAAKKGTNNEMKISVDSNQPRYWVYAAGRKSYLWQKYYREGIMAIGWGGIGDLNQYESKEDMAKAMQDILGEPGSHINDALATWEFSRVMKPGDIIFVKRGKNMVVGRGIVVSNYIYTEDSVSEDQNNIREVQWTHQGEWTTSLGFATKTLTDITSDLNYVNTLKQIFNDADGKDKNEEIPYGRMQFLEEVYLDGKRYDEITSILKRKKNIILQGPPGVGKTYAAKRLAYSLLGVKKKENIEFIQFHQSYAYEDFIRGYKPTKDGGFELRDGVFYQFCRKACESPEEEFFFIIDEINRGNLSKIFGETLMAIESDHRGEPIEIPYGEEDDTELIVPENLYIIGMMNTADRSLALIDYALRRRFSFIDMEPAFDSHVFISQHNTPQEQALIQKIKELNADISDDPSLGDGFRIGHSYFCEGSDLASIVKYEILPTLKEYWFDNSKKYKEWKQKLTEGLQ